MAIQVPTELLDGSVLALLTHEDYYGYTLTQEIQKVVAVSESTMYPVLRRLKKNGWLATYDQPYQGRNRRYYRLTDTGRAQLALIRKDWAAFSAGIDTLLGGEKDD